jgi:large subunit ribosomal protein L24
MVKQLHIRKNDLVVVLSGREKGKRGKVLKVSPKNRNAILENVNFIKKHTRANQAKRQKGGIVEREAPLDVSNLMLVCPECDTPSRIRYKLLENKKKVRICSKCEGLIDK